MSSRVLARIATTGIYLLRGVPRDLQRTARVRAVREGTTLRWVLLQALRGYAAGTWRPQPDAEPLKDDHGDPAVEGDQYKNSLAAIISKRCIATSLGPSGQA